MSLQLRCLIIYLPIVSFFACTTSQHTAIDVLKYQERLEDNKTILVRTNDMTIGGYSKDYYKDGKKICSAAYNKEGDKYFIFLFDDEGRIVGYWHNDEEWPPGPGPNRMP